MSMRLCYWMVCGMMLCVLSSSALMAEDAEDSSLESETESDQETEAEVEVQDIHDLHLIAGDNAENRWRVVNDNVMGGRSIGGFAFEEDHLIFSGSINTNGGGFSSIRANVDEAALAEADGIELRIQGDDRNYKVGFHQGINHRFSSVTYRVPMQYEASDDWQVVRIPFDQAKASWRGQSVRNAPDLDPAKIQWIDLMLSDGRDGEFRLVVESIRWYAEESEEAEETR